ncbi:MAG: 50S ribosomal protein L4 [Nitrospirota bacterium]
MPEIEIIDCHRKIVGKINLKSEIFGVEINKPLIHEVVVNYLTNKRSGTASTKTRGLVSGSGRKPWRQKGTGRARVGSIRSPLWRGGGTVFGPMPKDYYYRVPKKKKWLAMNSALSSKLSAGELIVLDRIEIPEHRTKLMVSMLKDLGITEESILILIHGDMAEKNILLASRNIPNVSVVRLDSLNVYDLLRHQKVLMTLETIKKIEEIFS